jgi:hypothetical protein
MLRSNNCLPVRNQHKCGLWQLHTEILFTLDVYQPFSKHEDKNILRLPFHAEHDVLNKRSTTSEPA